MQAVADVLNLEVVLAARDHALGAAVFAAGAARVYENVADAQRPMSPGVESVYRPDPQRAEHHDRLYQDYPQRSAPSSTWAPSSTI
jgi:L-ribulokinase